MAVPIEEQFPWLFDLYYQLGIVIATGVLLWFVYSILKYRYKIMQMVEERAKEIYILLISVYTILGIYYIFFGQVNYDEGTELYVSKLVYTGKIPYIDFMYTHPPLLSYIYGIPQVLFGPSLYIGRLTSLLFGVLTLVFTAKIAERLAGKIGGIIALALISFNLYAIYLFSYAKSYELTAFFMVLSLYFLFCSNRFGNSGKYILAIIFMSLATGVRQSILPMLILLVLYVVYIEKKNIRTVILSSVTAILTVGIIFVPFLILNSNVTMFNLYYFYGGDNPYYTPYNKVSTFLNIVDKFLVTSVLLFVGALILLLDRQRHSNNIKFLYIGTFFVFVAHLIPAEALPEYPVILTPVASILAGYGFSEIYRNSKEDLTRYLSLLLITIMILFVLLSKGPQWVDISGNKRPIQEIDEMAAYIKDNTPEDGKLLAFSTYIAVEANRELLPGLSQAYYTYRADWSDEKAKQYNGINPHLLNQYVQSQSASAILLTDWEKAIIGHESVSLIEENYNLVRTMSAWGQHVNTAYLYLPKDTIMSLQNFHVNYGDTQSWSVKGLPPGADYLATLRWSDTALIIGQGTADPNGEASGSFGIGTNILPGAASLRIELASDPSKFEEKTFVVGELSKPSITVRVEKSRVNYGATQSWSAAGLPPHASYLVTIKSAGKPEVLILGSGIANANGEARASFGIGTNLSKGDNILRIELTSLSSYFGEATFTVG